MQVIILDPLTFVIFIPSGFCVLGITNLPSQVLHFMHVDKQKN